jgi:CYTH domain-containing protein
MTEHTKGVESPLFRHQIVLREPVRYESVHKEAEFELKFHPGQIPPFLEDALRATTPKLIEQIYVVIPVTSKKGKEKLLEGRIRRVSDPHTKVMTSFSVEKKKKRKGVGVNGETRLVLSAREEKSLQDEFGQLLRVASVPKVRKLRYHIPQTIRGVDGVVHFHIDVFEGANKGSTLIEAEFESKQAEKQFRKQLPPGLEGSEVTDIHAFRNSHIAFYGFPKGDHDTLRKVQE